jgi:hypothetical protein
VQVMLPYRGGKAACSGGGGWGQSDDPIVLAL